MLSRATLALALAVLAVAGCGKGAPPSAHARVACVGCHRDGVDASGRTGVPDAACSTERCHPTGGPERVRTAMVVFAHTNHPDGRGGVVPCASCHSHQGPDSLTLAAGTAACTLCHEAELRASSGSACATCHVNPDHTQRTSQGVALPHAVILDAQVPCTRCHYRVAEGTTEVAATRCATCHPAGEGRSPLDTMIGADSSHAAHREIACSACHAPVVHRVVAMSSSINLQCLSCHSLLHRPRIPADSVPDSTCGNCHEGIHRDAQQMVLGILPGDSVRPSSMFLGGVTCQSCHVPPDRAEPAPGVSLRGTNAACTGCHGSAWNGVLARWRRGYQRRDALAAAYLAGAQRALGDSASPAVATRLREAAGLLAFVRRSGPLHNLALTDRLMRRSIDLVHESYVLSDGPAPAPPLLGPALTDNTCLSCHYGIEEAPISFDSVTGRPGTHADHIFRGLLQCDACHAAGAAPPGLAGRPWIDTVATPSRPPR